MWNKLFDISLFDYEFVYKDAFWLFIIIPILILWQILKNKDNAKNINISTLDNFDDASINWPSILKWVNFSISLIAVSLIIISLAKPQDPIDIEKYNQKNIEGIDVMVSLDVSASMLAQDFKPNRLESAKTTALNFIKKRPTDRIGLVVYEGEAYTQAPLTTDHELLATLIEDIQTGLVQGGTAIGSGLITAVNRLRESDAKSKVIVLLTDGVNNQGEVDPILASQIANEFGIRVYTIGIGKNGTAPYPVESIFGTTTRQIPVELDEDLLKNIASTTDGLYFRAKNEKELESIYDEIDLLEKSKVRIIEFKTDPPDKYYGFLWIGIVLLLTSKIIENTLLKSIN